MAARAAWDCQCPGILNCEQDAKLRGNWQSLHPTPAKMAFCLFLLEATLQGCVVAEQWALTFLYKGGLEAWEEEQLREGVSHPQEEVPFGAEQWRAW